MKYFCCVWFVILLLVASSSFLYADFSSGEYFFQAELAPVNLLGEFPFTYTGSTGQTHNGTIEFTTFTAKGDLVGTLSLGGRPYRVVGKVKFGSKSRISLTATYNNNTSETLKMKGLLSASRLAFDGVATSNNKSTLTPGKGVFKITLSDTAELVADVSLNVSVNSKGKITGSGSVDILGMNSFNVTAVGKARNGNLAQLKIVDNARAGFKMNFKGPAACVPFKAKAFGAATVGCAEFFGEPIFQESELTLFVNPDVNDPLIALAEKNGEWLTMHGQHDADGNTLELYSVTHRASPDKEAYTLTFADDGLPAQLITQGLVFSFSNWQDNRVDCMVMDDEGNVVFVPDIEVDPDYITTLQTLWTQGTSAQMRSWQRNLGWGLKVGAYALDGIACWNGIKIGALAGSIIPVKGTIVGAVVGGIVSCGPLVAQLYADLSGNETAEIIATGAGINLCHHGHYSSCFSTAAHSAGDYFLEEAQAHQATENTFYNTTGQLRGIVRNASSRQVLANTRVQVYSGQNLVSGGQTDSNGRYLITLSAGTNYRVVVERSGYTSATHSGVRVTAQQTTSELETLLQPFASLTISPSSRNHGSGSGTGSISVSSNVSWTAVKSASWITITSGSSGSNNGTVNYSVSANTGAARSGTISVSGGGLRKTFTVSQDLYTQASSDFLAYYPFSGNASDASVNGLNATVYGAVLTTDRFGQSGQVYYFDGNDDYLRVSNVDLNISDFTISLWLYADEVAANYKMPFSIHSGGYGINYGDKNISLFYNRACPGFEFLSEWAG